MEFTEFWTICSANGIVLDLEHIARLKRYHKELLNWNSKVNLISRRDEEYILERHIMHSLSVMKYIDLPAKAKCIDIGTGGGLPGIPICIYRPDIHMLLVDSIAKKLKLTAMFADHTGIRYLKAKRARAEELSELDEHRRHYDFVFARGVTRAVKLIDWTEDLLKTDGTLVLFKGGDLADEINEMILAYPDIKYELIDINFFAYPGFKAEEKKILKINIK